MRINPIILMLVTALSLKADVISWTNTAGGNWNATANWSPNQVPGASDTAIITNAGTYTVMLNVTTNGLLLLASSGNKTLNGTITNAGVVRWTGTGNLIVRGAIHNLPGSLFDIQNNEVLDFVSGTPVVVNEGTFRKSAGASTTTCQIPFHNFGRVEVNTGTLSFYSTGVFTDHAGTIALGGGTVQTTQPLALSGGQLTGQGTVKPGTGLTSAALVAPAGSNGVLTTRATSRNSCLARWSSNWAAPLPAPTTAA